MTLDSRDIDIIAERVDLWIRTGDPFDLRADDVLALIAEVRQLGRQHKRDLALLRKCREQLAAATERVEQLGNTVTALAAQDAAELDPP